METGVGPVETGGRDVGVVARDFLEFRPFDDEEFGRDGRLVRALVMETFLELDAALPATLDAALPATLDAALPATLDAALRTAELFVFWLVVVPWSNFCSRSGLCLSRFSRERPRRTF